MFNTQEVFADPTESCAEADSPQTNEPYQAPVEQCFPPLLPSSNQTLVEGGQLCVHHVIVSHTPSSDLLVHLARVLLAENCGPQHHDDREDDVNPLRKLGKKSASEFQDPQEIDWNSHHCHWEKCPCEVVHPIKFEGNFLAKVVAHSLCVLVSRPLENCKEISPALRIRFAVFFPLSWRIFKLFNSFSTMYWKEATGQYYSILHKLVHDEKLCDAIADDPKKVHFCWWSKHISLLLDEGHRTGHKGFPDEVAVSVDRHRGARRVQRILLRSQRPAHPTCITKLVDSIELHTLVLAQAAEETLLGFTEVDLLSFDKL
mmetsp:Transcript_34603/g.79158  ORF Transcript_34603/g.79158 Transcript_34603/m.79158 type:complete len:316 (+) Transcript_34603:1379-2326(+)